MEVTYYTAAEAYSDLLWKMKICGVEEMSRNGPVFTIQTPVLVTIIDPLNRVILDPIRDANPFFHVMEFIWLMSASREVAWISKFNKRFGEYANGGIVNGAYGYRWRHPVDQISAVIGILRHDPTSRRAVLSMWSAMDVEGKFKDHPCNTHITLRIVDGKLNMLVMNRSNDLIWGMMGSNVVCFTMLLEYLASRIGCGVGTYSVVTSNLHVYPEMPRYKEIAAQAGIKNETFRCAPMDFPVDTETLSREFVENKRVVSGWFADVVEPMYMAYITPTWDQRIRYAELIKCPAWREAAIRWLLRREPK